MTGKLIVFEGIDGAGKATQCTLLRERLAKAGYTAEYIDFPQYGKWPAVFVEKFLTGELGKVEDVSPYQASIFFALDRYVASRQLREWLAQGKIIISNRYVSSSLAHHGGALKDEQERGKFFRWVRHLEYGVFGIPKPDLTILLHTPAETSQHLVDKKEARPYVGGKKRDIVESDIDYLRAAEIAYLELSKKKHWLLVECVNKGALLSPKEIADTIWAQVEEFLKESI